jgi:hypothetical protein
VTEAGAVVAHAPGRADVLVADRFNPLNARAVKIAAVPLDVARYNKHNKPNQTTNKQEQQSLLIDCVASVEAHMQRLATSAAPPASAELDTLRRTLLQSLPALRASASRTETVRSLSYCCCCCL